MDGAAENNPHLDWVIEAARSSYSSNMYRAKSWLLVGSTLYPENISIKLEFYHLAKSAGLIQEAAQNFSVMLKSAGYEKHTALQKELQMILASVQNNDASPTGKLSNEIFSALPEEQQCNILKNLSVQNKDPLMRCSVLLLLIRRFPHLSKDYGPSLIEILFEAEIKEYPANCNNIYRRYFVTEGLPIMLKESTSNLDKKITLNWLDKALQFYVTLAFQNTREGMITSPPVQNPSKLMKTVTSRPWESLSELLSLTARHVKWNINPQHFTDNNALMSYLTSLHQRFLKEHSKSVKKELVYNSTYLLFKLIHQYNVILKKNDTVCLLQNKFGAHSGSSKKTKRVLETAGSIACAENIVSSELLLPSFKMACSIWTILHSESSLKKAFEDLLEKLDYQNWKSVMSSFTRDRTFYQREFDTYLELNENPVEAHSIQLACCQLALGKTKAAVSRLLEVLPSLRTDSDSHAHSFMGSDSSNSDYLFVSDSKDLMNTGLQIILQGVKDAMLSEPGNDDIRGNLVVLLQHDWPARRNDFVVIIEDIKSAKKFSYPSFFDYVINVDMLEEFAYLKSEQGGSVSLDIQPVSVQKLTKHRTVTRGVAKDVKEDFKALFEKQVSRSSECLYSLLMKFLSERKHELLAPL